MGFSSHNVAFHYSINKGKEKGRNRKGHYERMAPKFSK